jgi:hypothetical protein
VTKIMTEQRKNYGMKNDVGDYSGSEWILSDGIIMSNIFL